MKVIINNTIIPKPLRMIHSHDIFVFIEEKSTKFNSFLNKSPTKIDNMFIT